MFQVRTQHQRKDIIGLRCLRSKNSILVKEDGTEAVTASEKAETLNRYFSSNLTDENMELPNDDTPFLCEYIDIYY